MAQVFAPQLPFGELPVGQRELKDGRATLCVSVAKHPTRAIGVVRCLHVEVVGAERKFVPRVVGSVQV